MDADPIREAEPADDAVIRHRPQRLFQDMWHKAKLWLYALRSEPFFLFGETGAILFTAGKSILDGAVLYSMFSMAEKELQAAAVLGVLTRYVYPALTVVGNVKVSSFIDTLEVHRPPSVRVAKLIRGLLLVAIGEFAGAVLLVMCYPPLFKACFDPFPYKKYVLIALFLFHHVCDGSAQIVEGRLWFRLIEIKIRHGKRKNLASHFWGIHAMSQNIQLIVGQVLLWSATLMVSAFIEQPAHELMLLVVLTGFALASGSKFILPLAWKLKLQRQGEARIEPARPRY